MRVSIPSTRTVPASGSRIALKCFASVDLPQPFAPSTANELTAADVQRHAVHSVLGLLRVIAEVYILHL